MVRCHADDGVTGGGAVRAQSETYDPFRPVRRVGFRAEIAIVDADAKQNASASSAYTMVPSTPAQTVDGVVQNPQTFATLEKNAWILDGNHAIMDEDASGIGWWSSAVSEKNGAFTAPINLVFDFSADAKTVGLVMHFVPGYQPAEAGMRIRAFDADGAIAADLYNTDGKPEQEIIFSAVYRRLQIDFYKTALPGRRIRMTEIDFGVTQRFDADTISDAEIRYKVDAASAALPYGECSLTVDNADRRWNILNPSGIYQYLEQGQRVSIWCDIDGEEVSMGSFAFRSVEARDGALTAKITAADIIAPLDDSNYNGGRCAAASLSAAISEVLDGTGIDCVFDDGTADMTVMMSIPKNTTRRESIRLLAQAAMACVYADRDGKLRFCRPSVVSAADAVTKQIPLVTADGFVLADADGNAITVPTQTDGIQRLTANELYDFDGITITEPVGIINLIVDDKYSGTEITYTAGNAGKERIERNPCVASENGDDVASWLLSMYARKKKYNVRNRCDPAMELLDTVRISDAYGQNDISMVTGITIQYNGGLTAETEAVG